MTGIIEEYTIQDGLFISKATQDVDPIMDANKAERNSGINDDKKSEMRKVASIPLVVVEALKKRPMSEGGPIDLNLLGVDLEHTLRFNRWLNDRDNQNFRTNNARQ
jgi:hypothetical protein